ncbi:MAG: DNA repair protein RecO [Burkholderiales bacterium]|nr:DNA repair protein RecO [Burkholderiales bacterium]MDQ3195436.1 DNA repair protein RecO [Pseudomonadota bacterium]
MAADKARQDAQTAFVLHTYPFRETSLVIEIFARDAGRVALVARGARRPKSALRGALLAFQPLALSWFGKNELRTLHRAEWLGGLPMLHGEALICGFYLNELLLKLLARDDPHPLLFDSYHAALQELAGAGEVAPILRRFEKRFLQELGYALTLTRDARNGATIEADRQYAYVMERGALPVAPAGVREKKVESVGPGTGGGKPPLVEISGKTLLDMARDDYSDATTLQQSKLLMRAIIDHYLGAQSLNTRQLMKDLRQL